MTGCVNYPKQSSQIHICRLSSTEIKLTLLHGAKYSFSLRKKIIISISFCMLFFKSNTFKVVMQEYCINLNIGG